MFNRDLGIVKWCRQLCDRVSRPVGGLVSIMLFSLFDSSSAFKGLPI